MNKKLQYKEIDNLVFFKKKYSDDWYISGTDLCRKAGYKNPDKVASQLYSKNKNYFPENDKEVKEIVLQNGEKYKTIARSTTLPGRGVKSQNNLRIYNKPAAYFFISLMRTDKAKQMTQVLMDTFAKLEKFLVSRKNESWKLAREKGKIGRLSCTDGIQLQVEYAKDCGSKNAETYYVNTTKAIYKALFGITKVPPKFRDSLPEDQLVSVYQIEKALKPFIEKCIEAGLEYHNVYLKIKERIEEMALLLIKLNKSTITFN